VRPAVWNWLADFVKPVRRVVPPVGEMRYLRQVSWWEGEYPFRAGGEPKQVSVIIRASRDGPKAQQIAFLEEVERRYMERHEEIDGRIREAAREAEVDGDASPVLCAIELPDDVVRSRWELSYNLSEATCTVALVGWHIESVVVEY
jgi:hypothetical protein